MKRKFTITSFVVLGILVLAAAQPALAGRGCVGHNVESETYIAVDKTAPGTKYNATLTIHYVPSTVCAPLHDMYLFLRVEGNVLKAANYYSGAELYAYFGIAECIQYWNEGPLSSKEAIAAQQQAVEDFFRFEVNPSIYYWNHRDDPDGCDPVSSDPDQMCPPFALKSIDKIVDGDALSDLSMTVLDLVIAIDDQ